MVFRLRDGLSWCECAGRAVFLDLERDRYFCLPDDADVAFRRWASSGGADDDPSLCDRLEEIGLLVRGRPSSEPPASAAVEHRSQGRSRHPAGIRTGLHRAIACSGSVTTNPRCNGSGAPG